MEAEANAADSKQEGRSTETARKPAAEKQGVNGSASAGAELDQEKDADADVSDELAKAKIEDETTAEGSS